MQYTYSVGDVENIFLNLSEENFEQRYGRHKPSKDSKIIFSCRSGRRSAMVQEAMRKLGYARYANIIFYDFIERLILACFAECTITQEAGWTGKASKVIDKKQRLSL
jgi:rhodanese-related sulfurtransferase